MKDLKEKCIEYEQKISLHNFLECHLKDVSPEERKDSFKRMASKPKNRLNVLPDVENIAHYT